MLGNFFMSVSEINDGIFQNLFSFNLVSLYVIGFGSAILLVKDSRMPEKRKNYENFDCRRRKTVAGSHQ